MKKIGFTLAEVLSLYPTCQRKTAFTLAEVLITLGIIGVVAALTMPMLIGHYKKEEAISRLKKSYTIINQALKRSEVENGEFQNWEIVYSSTGGKAYIEKYWLPYFNVAKICNKPIDCGYASNEPYKYANGANASFTFTAKDRRVPFMTTDGIVYSISTISGASNNPDYNIYIDINGSKGPNTFGKDLFYFVRVEGKGVLPYGYNLQESTINSNCSKTGVGNVCAQKLISNGWKFSEDYPF